jgi:putative membrane protein
MKRIGFILLAIAAVLIGLLVGTLNSDPVQLDLLWIQFESPLGLAILLGFSLGVVIGLAIIYFTRVLPLRLQLRKARAKLIKQDAADLNLPDD